MKLVKVVDLQVHTDDRGHLFEVLHNYDLKNGKFGQVYIVHNPVRDTVRAFHKHNELWDYFCIIKGSAKFVFAKDGTIEEITVSEKCPKLIIVPPKVYHGWKSLEDNTILLSIGSELYNRENPDEERVEWNKFSNWEQTKK